MNKLILLILVGLSGVASAQEPAPPPAPSEARKACTDAMNADPAFAQSIVLTADKTIDKRSLEAHQKAAAQIAENERHVIYAYAAMWIIAALFVVFMWWRQQGLKAELATLRRDLDAAAKETK